MAFVTMPGWGGAQQPPQSRAAGAAIPVDTAALDAHLRFLASDLLEGRAPATRGGGLATAYIAAQFQALGLEPAGEKGSYFQPVALVGMSPQPTFAWGKTGAGTAPDSLPFRDAFVAWAERPEADIAANGEVVFVGYGIRAPEWQWDDYKSIDLRGKVLLMLVNDPGLVDSTVFLGKILTYYGRWTYKLEEAARQGAAGAILVHTTESATYPWDVVRGSWSVEQFKLDQAQTPSLAVAGWVTAASARTALAKAGLNLDSLSHAAARRDFRPVATGIQASVRVKSALRRVQSDNVVARLPGRDPQLAGQAVLITAH
ncbi:MAG: peptidase M28, partial [Burkholderiales bacterium]